MTDINAVIAVHRGWKKCKSKYNIWESPQKKLFTGCPDFEHTARLYMALFEEMDFPDLYKNWNKKWICTANGVISKDTTAESDTIGTAICLAYCKLHGLECE